MRGAATGRVEHSADCGRRHDASVHTAVKLAPKYGYCVVHGGDASRTATLVKRLLTDREGTIHRIREEQEEIRRQYYAGKAPLLPYREALAHAPAFPAESYAQPDGFGEDNLTGKHIGLETFMGYIDWTPFSTSGDSRGNIRKSCTPTKRRNVSMSPP